MSAENEALAEAIRSFPIVGGPDVDLSRPLAQHLLEQGYWKPRTITTAEELDALRVVGAAIQWGGKVYGADLAIPGDRPYWFGPGRATATTVCPSVDFPATVLHEGETA